MNEQVKTEEKVIEPTTEIVDSGAEDLFNSSVEEKQAKVETQEETVIYEGFGRKFTSSEDLAEYTKELEMRVASSEMEKHKASELKQESTVAKNIGAQQQDSVVTDEMSDKIFENPKAVLQELETKIEQKYDRKANQQQTEKNFWEGFYADNQDLKKSKRVVDLILKEKSSILSSMEVNKGKEYLAKETRSFMEGIGGNLGTKEKLTNEGTTNLGTSQLNGGAQTKVVEKSDFVSEMRSYQRKN